jgi:hypothetical protein
LAEEIGEQVESQAELDQHGIRHIQPLPSTAPLPEFQEDEIRAYVGPNADYYLRRWRGLLAGEYRGAGFNFGAFLLSGLYLPYRKMWGKAFLLYGFLLAVQVAEVFLFRNVIEQPPPERSAYAVGLLVALVCGARANRWYFTQTTRAIAYVRWANLEGKEARTRLKRQGWTTLGGAIGILVAYFLLAYGTATVLEAVVPPTAKAIAAEVKPLILREWQKQPALRGATIQNITLVSKGDGVYTGTVDAVLDGESERLSLVVERKGGTIGWELKPLRRR